MVRPTIDLAPAPGSFGATTAITPLGDGRWRADLDERWQSLIALHGGYAAAIVVRALLAELEPTGQALRNVTTRFVRSPKPGPADVEVHVERQGRTVSFASGRLVQGDRTVLLVDATFATPTDGGLRYDEHRAPRRSGPAPEGLPRFDGGGLVNHFRQVDLRLDPDVVPFSGTGSAWIGAWMRPLDDEPVDVAWLVAAGDFLPPASFSRSTGPTRAASIDYSIFFPIADPVAHVPIGADLYVETHSMLAADGMAVEDGVLWAPDGTVVAVSRQTRLGGDDVPHSMAPRS
jgi:acyl-CoA thioesterase